MIYRLTILLAVSLFTGCSSLDRYERTYSAAIDPDTKSGSVSVTLRPITPSAPSPSTLDQKAIADLVAQALAKYEDKKVVQGLNQ